MNNKFLQHDDNSQYESLSKKTLCEIIAGNMIQIARLTSNNNALQARNEELERDKEIYQMIIKENKELMEEHKTNIEKLMNENTMLNNKFLSLEKHIDNQDKRITELEKNIQEFKNRDEPITVREGFVSLEKYIIIEILGSKNKVRNFYGVVDLVDLFRSKEYEKECKNFLIKYGLTTEHINFIPDMKEYGNTSAHKRPIVTKNEFEKMALLLISDNDDDDKNMLKDLLEYLEIKNPIDETTGLWEIKKPY